MIGFNSFRLFSKISVLSFNCCWFTELRHSGSLAVGLPCLLLFLFILENIVGLPYIYKIDSF